MALKIGKKETRVISITAIEPLDKDKTKTHSFEAEFKILPKDDWQALLKDNDSLIIDIAYENLVDVQDIVDESGSPVAFDNDVKQEMMNQPWLNKSVIDGFMAVQGGVTNAEYKRQKLKN